MKKWCKARVAQSRKKDLNLLFGRVCENEVSIPSLLLAMETNQLHMQLCVDPISWTDADLFFSAGTAQKEDFKQMLGEEHSSPTTDWNKEPSGAI